MAAKKTKTDKTKETPKPEVAETPKPETTKAAQEEGGPEAQEDQRPRRGGKGTRGGGPADDQHGDDRGYVQEGLLDLARWCDPTGNALFRDPPGDQNQGEGGPVPEN